MRRSPSPPVFATDCPILSARNVPADLPRIGGSRAAHAGPSYPVAALDSTGITGSQRHDIGSVAYKEDLAFSVNGRLAIVASGQGGILVRCSPTKDRADHPRNYPRTTHLGRPRRTLALGPQTPGSERRYGADERVAPYRGKGADR